ncbi:MAG: hypothetical protein JSR39_03630, partial [Verrucomicrobia bacterium]|nr:hypothetical protein [Verrucomicrobiota bacterium]
LDPNGDLILISADIGTGTRIGALTIDGVSNADFQKITAASLSQAVGTGTTTFHDTIDVNGASGISLSGTGFTFENTVNASAGPVSIANSGTLAFNSGANVTSASNFLQNGTGPLHLANAITTTNGTINCFSNITLTGTASLDSSAGNKQILLHGLIDGANDLSLASGAGSITAIQAIGSGSRVGNLSLSSSGVLSFNAINAGSITQTGTATAVYNADLNTNAAGGISLTGAAITLGGNATTSAAGPITIANSGLFTAPIGKTLNADGGFSQSGGNVSLGSNVLANSAPIAFGSPITLTSDVLLNSMSSGSGGGNITVGTVDGAFGLTFTLGSGDLTAGNIGDTMPLTAVIATSVHDNNAQNITAGNIQQYAGSGTTTLNGDMTSTSSLGITLVGTNFTRAGKIITQNGGSFTVTNSGVITGTSINTTDIDGFYIQNGAGTTNFAGTITARQGISFSGPLVLLFNGTLDTSSGNGNITLSNTIDNFDLITPHSLTVNAGVGNITLSSALGAGKPLSSLKLTGNTVSIANIGTAGTPGLTGTLQIPDPASLITPNQIVFNGTAVNALAQTYAATTSFNMNSGALTTILSNGQPVNFTTGTVLLAANTDLTVNSVSGTTGGNITTTDIHAGANSQRSLTLNAGTAIASPGTILPGTIGLAGNGEFASVSLTGVLTLPNSIAANAITFTPTGAMTVGGNLTTVNSGLTFPTAVTLTGSRTFATSGGSILFSSTLDGDANDTRSLALAAGTGDITFANAVGGTFRLNVLGIASARNVTATAAGASITAASIVQSSGSGTTEFGGNVSTTASPGVTFNGKNLQFDSTSVLNTANSGSLFVANVGTFTFAGTATLSGGVSQVGPGAVALSGSIAAGQPVSFAAPVGLTGTPSIDTSSTGQTITFSNTVNGPGGLSLKAGNGNIAMNNTIGGTTSLGAMTIISANNIDLQPLSAASLTFTNFSGLATYQTITTTGAAGVQLTGNNFIRNGALNVGGGGSLTITNSGFIRGFATNTAMIDGSYTQNGAGPNDLSGSITVGNNISFASAIALMDPSSLTTTGNGTITLSSAVDGNQDLTLSAGSGTINLNGTVGTTNRIGVLTISSAGAVSAQAINAASIIQSSGSGTTTFNGNLNTNSTAGISLTGTNFVRGANWTTSNSGPITLSLASGGSFTSTAAGTINSAGAFSQLGLGSVSLAQTINTTNAAILFSGPVSLAGTTTLNTGSAGGITFNNTLDGAAALILTGGAGDIMAGSAVGGGTRLGDITINSANNVDFQALKAASLTQLSGGGTTTLNGPTDLNTALGIDFNGNNCTINGSLTTSNTGGISIENDGLLSVTGTCSVDGDFIQNGMGPSILSGAITSVGGQIAFSSPVTASGSPQLTTSSQPITFSSTLDGASSGSGNLTLDAGAGGDITFTGAIGSINRLGSLSLSNVRNAAINAITAGSITQAAGAGTTSILGTINTSNVLGINLIGHAFTINGSIITTNGGPMSLNHANLLTLICGPSTLISGPFTESGAGTVSMSGLLHTDSADITFNNPITLLNPTTINSDGSGDILISSTIDGATDLTLDSGTNSITVLGAIGGTTPLNNFVIADAKDASFQAINAQTITQSAGTGTTTFNAAVTTSLASGLGLTGNAFTFNAPVTTNGSGKVQINNSGLLTISAAGTMTLTGPFTQIGTGSTLLSGNISVDNDAISFAGPVALGNTVSLNTATATGSITFFNTLDGAQDLNLTAGIGAINFNGAVGGTAPLGALNVVSVFDLNSQSITASSINLSTAYDLATFNGPLSTSGAPGIVLSGYSFTFNNNVTTANTGPLTVTNTGPVTFSPTSLVTVDGPFAMNGTGLVNAGGTLTTNNQPATFSSAVLLNGNYSINTGTTGANVMFSSDLDGPFNLNIAAGLGDVLVQKAVDDGSALNNFTVAAHDVTLTGVGTTATGVVGELSLMASDAINLGNQFYSAGTQTYTAATAINFVNSLSVTTLNSFGGPISFNGAPVVLSNGNDLSIFTNNGALSYTSISGTTFENISINMGNGTAFMNPITGSHINNLLVNAGQIELIGSINAVNTDFESLGAIFNSSAPQAVNSLNIATFNALNGDVGTIASPILVHSSNQVFAGAGGRADSLAVFNGSSVDNTIHAITSNPPCIIIFNGVEIKNCNAPPVPPTPSGQRAHAKAIPPFPFAVPGFDSSYFNLASDYFFFPYFFDDSYVRKDAPMYYRAPAQTSNRAESFGRYKPYYFNLFKPFKGLNLELETGKHAADLFAFLQIENRAPFEGKPKVKKSS